MFKVECPGCKAPYQVDERRVPTSGLKMRCPKCGSSFKVDSPDPQRAASSGMGAALGVNADSMPPPALGVPSPAAVTAPPGSMPASLKTTMLGVGNPLAAAAIAAKAAPPAAPPAPARPKPAAPPAPSANRGSEPEFDLPLPVTPPGAVDLPSPAPAKKGPPPAPRRPGPPPPPPRATAPSAPGAGSAPGAAVPPPRAPLDSSGLELDLAPPSGLDLPLPAAPRGADFHGADLPVVGTSSARVSSPALDLELPSIAARKPPAQTPAVSGFGSIELDLPDHRSVPPPRAPAVAHSGAPGLPAPRASRNSGEIELPSLQDSGRAFRQPSSADLPSLGGLPVAAGPGAGLPVRSGSPSARSISGLPAALGGEVGLPSLGGAGLPASSSVGLPSLGGAGLPVSGGAGLPLVGGPGLPSLGGPGLPLAGGPGLPSAPPSAPGSLPPFELEAPSASGFGELDLPPLAPASIPPPMGGRLDDGFEADPFGEAPLPPPRSQSDPRLGRASPSGAPSFMPSPASAGNPVIREAGGGTAYGEVNLEGDTGSGGALEAGAPRAALGSDEGMEFDAVPQEPARASAAVRLDGPSSARVSLPAPGSGAVGTTAPRTLPKARKPRWRLVAVVFVVAVGGASLAFVPRLGPFGAYWIVDRVRADEYAKLLDDSVTRARKELASDTAPDGARAAALVDAARAEAKRVSGLSAYAAFIASSRELRFGSDPEVRARAKVLLDELALETGVPYLELARAARAATDGQLARARQLVTAALRVAPTDLDALWLRAEVELRARDAAGAVAAWQALSQRDPSARAAFGLSRAHFSAGEWAAAEQNAALTLQRNPSHVGARILLARIAAKTPGREDAAIARLGEVDQKAKLASQEERVSAQTLLGDIHLGRSRISRAEQAYTEALKINPKAARALIGLGEALYRAGRYAEAQARFEAGAQAEPDELLTKVGVAKSKLMLERVEEAQVSLKKLNESHPDSLLVSYWFGRCLDAAGDRVKAEAVLRAGIASATGDPLLVDVYVALAQLQSQQGRAEAAGKTLIEAKDRLPGSAAVHRALGDWSLTQGHYAEAEVEFKKAIELDPNDLAAHFWLGVAYRRDGRFKEAGVQFDEVARVDSQYPGLALERGLKFEGEGLDKEALDEYEKALAKAPTDPDLMLRVGCAYASAERTKDAEALLRKVLSLRPTSAETNYCIGRALLLEGSRLADALRMLDRAVELDPHRAQYHLYVGWAANEAGNVPKAERALAQALAIDQSLADAYWQRGVLRQRQGAVRDALTDLTRALSLRPTRYEAHAALAEVWFDLGKEQAALGEWQQAVQARPDNANWRFRYGKLLLANHNLEAGRTELTRSLELAEKKPRGERWLWEAHHLLARALGDRAEAGPHWEEFLRVGPLDSPYRQEAKNALAKLGRPWNGN